MRKRLLQFSGVTLILLAATFAPAQRVQACSHECFPVCDPPGHCCISGSVQGCAECIIGPCPG